MKNTEGTTNYQPEHLSTNTLLRTQRKADEGKMGKCYARQKNHITKEWVQIPSRPCSTITLAIIEEDVASFAAHKRHVSDYLLEDVWHRIDETGNWIFKDGEAVDTPDTTIKPMHFSYLGNIPSMPVRNLIFSLSMIIGHQAKHC